MLIILAYLAGVTIVSIGACFWVPKKSMIEVYPVILKSFCFIESVLILLLGFMTVYIVMNSFDIYILAPVAVCLFFALALPQTVFFLLVRYIRAINNK